MKLFAIRDRMIDYFMVPFPAPDENQAMAGISHEVNRTDVNSAIQQAPHHFELYLLGEIDESGTIFPRKELVCDCANLVRPRREATQPEVGMAPRATNTPLAETPGSGTNGGTAGRAIP